MRLLLILNISWSFVVHVNIVTNTACCLCPGGSVWINTHKLCPQVIWPSAAQAKASVKHRSQMCLHHLCCWWRNYHHSSDMFDDDVSLVLTQNQTPHHHIWTLSERWTAHNLFSSLSPLCCSSPLFTLSLCPSIPSTLSVGGIKREGQRWGDRAAV